MFSEPYSVFRGEGFVPEQKLTQYYYTHYYVGVYLGGILDLGIITVLKTHRRIPAVNIAHSSQL